MIRFLFVITSVLFFFLSSCGKEEDENIIPGYPSFKVDLNNLDKELRTAGAIKTFTKPRLDRESIGFSGLIVVSGWAQDDGVPVLYAFDLCCPNEKRRDVMVTPSEKDGTATCKTCGKTYELHFGGYEKGTSSKSRFKLQPYRVRNESNNTVFYITR